MSEHCDRCNLIIAPQEDRVERPDKSKYHISCWLAAQQSANPDNGNVLPAKMELKRTGEKKR